MENKKVYPSELATKSIACRVPAPVYVEILNDAIKKGINVNDWLLRKVFSDDIIGKTEETNKPFISLEDIKNGSQIFKEPTIFKKIKSWVETYGETKEDFLNFMFGITVHVHNLEIRNDELVDELEKNNYRVADINDVINQVTILVQGTEWSQKEKEEFRSEILPLLKELKP